MRKSAVIIGTLSALLIAVIYDRIDRLTGMKFDALLYISIVAMVIGVCTELYVNNKDMEKEES